MKKVLSGLLCILLVMTMFGCEDAPIPNGQNSAPPTTSEASSAEQPEEQPEESGEEAPEVITQGGYVESMVEVPGVDYFQSVAFYEDAMYIMTMEYPEIPEDMTDGDKDGGEAEPAEEAPEESAEPAEEEAKEEDAEPTEEKSEEEAAEGEEILPDPVIDSYRPKYILKRVTVDGVTEEEISFGIDNININSMGIGADGKPFFVIQDDSAWDEFYKNMPEGYEMTDADYREIESKRGTKIFVEKDGSYQAIGEALTGDIYINQAYGLPDGGYALCSYNGVFILDAEGKQVRKFGENMDSMAVAGNIGYMLEQSGLEGKIVGYDLTTGESTGEVAFPESEKKSRYRYFNGLAVDAQENLYVQGQEGVYKYSAADKSWEHIIDGIASIFGSGDSYARYFFVDSKGSVYVPTEGNWDGRGERPAAKMYIYSWSDAIEFTGAELNIVAVQDFYQMRTLANRFQRAHPEVKVNYRAYGDEMSPQVVSNFGAGEETMDYIKQMIVNQDDAVRAINTETLAGSAADIYVLDGMPMESYISKGYLMDLTEWVNGRDTDGTWMGHVSSSYRQEDGTLPCVVTSYTAPLLWGDKATLGDVKTLDDLRKIAEGMKEGEQFWMTYQTSSVMAAFYPSCQNDWIGENGRIDFMSPAFKEYLETCKAIQDTMPTQTLDFNDSESWQKWYEKTWTDMLESKILFYPDWLYYRGGFDTGNAIMKKRGGESLVRAYPSQSDKTAYIPQQIVGVSKESKNQKAALQFLDMIMGDEAQQSWGISGYPVNIKAFEESIKIYEPELDEEGNEIQSFSRGAMIIGNGVEIEMENMTPELNQKLKDLVSTLDTPSVVDMTLLSMIYEETLPYFEGKSTVDAVVSSLNSRARAYLME